MLKYSEQSIRDHLSGTKVRNWIGSEYDAVFNFILHCFLQPSQDIHFHFPTERKWRHCFDRRHFRLSDNIK